jgi:ethanolamine utilization protein EutA
MNFGGRVIEIDPRSGSVTHITPAGLKICDAAGVRLAPGDVPSLADLQSVTRVMADLALNLLEGSTSPLASALYQTPPLPVPSTGRPVMFSGGIGYYFYNPVSCTTLTEIARHGDIGPLLAESIRQHPRIAAYHSVIPAETQRATVLGASNQTMTLSGSTIWARADLLPLRNLPVVRANPDPAQADPANSAREIGAALQRVDIKPGTDIFALSLELDAGLDYPSLTRVAAGLAEFYRLFPPDHPIIIVLEKDLAQAVGQTLQGLLTGRPLLVIDQVGMREGDYIDIGAPLMDGRVVPLVVKTLVFFH